MEGQAPCPDRIVDDFGNSFALGCVGGSVFHGIKGMRNSPRGDRLRGALAGMRLRGPVTGGNFATWGGLFGVYDCIFMHLRNKVDPINPIAAGFCVGGTLAARAGPQAAFKSAVVGGVLLALIEGMQILMMRYVFPPQEPTTLLSPPKRDAVAKGQKKVVDLNGGGANDSSVAIQSLLGASSPAYTQGSDLSTRMLLGRYNLYNEHGTANVALSGDDFLFRSKDDEML